MVAKSTWVMITDRMKDLKKLYDRMDKSKDQAYLKDYELLNFNNQPIKNVLSMTSNRPAVEANAIISDLMGAKWQTAVEGEITSRQAHVIEDFINDNLDMADEFILKRFGLSGLYDWLCNHVCVRSLIGVRWLSIIEDGKYHVDCVPCDMRWTPHLSGKDGWEWVAPITFRNSNELREELEGIEGADISRIRSDVQDIEVRDFWDGEKNELWVAEQLIYKHPHNLDKPPFVIVYPPAGFMLRDKGYLEHEAEDIFFLNRALYEEYNRSLSIEASIGMDVLMPPYAQEVELLDAEPSPPLPKTGQQQKYKKGEVPQPLKRGDLNNASMVFRQDILRQMGQGGVNDIDLGNIMQDRSAVWITEQTEIRRKLIRSRLKGLEIFREGLGRLMIEQFIVTSKGTSDLMIGKTGRKSKYSVSQLGDPEKYSISCELMTQSKKQEIANLAVANAARGTAPLKVILRDILTVEDPDGWLRELELEEAKRADPAIALFEMAIRYAEEAAEVEDEKMADAKRIQSKMLTERGVAIIQQRKQPAPLPEKAQVPQVEPTKAQSQALMPLMGRVGVEGGAPITTPRED